MTNDQASKLKELALAATPGPWKWIMGFGGWKSLIRGAEKDIEVNRVLYVRNDGLAGMRHADGDYIAAANPTTILDLLAERESLRARVEELEGALDDLRPSKQTCFCGYDRNRTTFHEQYCANASKALERKGRDDE